MKPLIIGREQQIQEMKAALKSGRPEMVALIGRRRVGKTFLVRQIYARQIVFELTGLQHGTKSEQLQNFTFALREYFPQFELTDKPTSWLEAFYFLS
ncbi:MAG: ATP-binding protein, partial [Bacteroidota bacterium]